jgi:opacity protein-like surface antigen
VQAVRTKHWQQNTACQYHDQGAFAMQRVVVFVVSSILLLSLSALAQENRSEISIQGTGLFTKNTSGNATAYSATGSGGFLGTYRYHLNRWLSVEGAYGYSQDTQEYLLISEAFRIQSAIHQFTGTMILNLPSRPHSRLSPYVLVGDGALLFTPNGNQFNSLSGASSQAQGAFVYGVGTNYALTRAFGLRVEYRGMVYSTPDFGFGGLATNSITHTAMPAVGLSFRF